MPAARNPRSHQKSTWAAVDDGSGTPTTYTLGDDDKPSTALGDTPEKPGLDGKIDDDLPTHRGTLEELTKGGDGTDGPASHGGGDGHGGSDGLVFEIDVSGSVRIGAGEHGGDGDGDLAAAHVGERHGVRAAALPRHSLLGLADVGDRPGQIAVPVHRVQ